MGLTITRSLVELHGGTIAVSSKVGCGSTFVVELPRVAIQPDAEAGSASASRSNRALVSGEKTHRVMVVEDDEAQLSVIRLVLEEAGFDVEPHHEAAGVADRLLDDPPDLLVLDIMMPHISGLTLLRLAKEDPKTRHIPVIVTSAYHANRDVVRQLGGHWVPKPWTSDALIGALVHALGLHRGAPPGAASEGPSEAKAAGGAHGA